MKVTLIDDKRGISLAAENEEDEKILTSLGVWEKQKDIRFHVCGGSTSAHSSESGSTTVTTRIDLIQ